MRKILAIVICLVACTTFTVKAQEKSESTNIPDKIYLRTGEVIDGTVTERNSKEVKFRSNDGINYAFAADEVDRIVYPKKAPKYNRSSFRGFLEFGYLIGIGAPRNNAGTISSSFGYQFNHWIYTGAGIGVDFPTAVVSSYPYNKEYEKNEDPNWRYPFVPLYLDIRSMLYDGNRITPFANVRVGASIFNHTGFYFNPNIGIHFPTRSTFSFNLSVGYNLQCTEYTTYYMTKTKVNLSNVSVKVGIEF